MSVVELVGWAAAFVGAVLGLPQLWRLIRTRNVDGLSLFAWQSILVVNLIWLAHGFRIEQPPQIVVNLIALCSTVPIVVVLARSTGRRLPLVLAPCLAAAAAIIAVDQFVGSAAYGVAAIIPGFTSTIGQTLELIRARQIRGVSPLFLVLGFVNQVLWTTWAVLVDDPGSIIAAAMVCLLTGVNLIWYLLRRLGLRPLFVREPALAG